MGTAVQRWREKFALSWLKAPQERSDEEIEAVPTESVHLERKSTLFGFGRRLSYYEIN